MAFIISEMLLCPQYQNVFNQWKEQARVNQLDASAITNLGSVACGMAPGDASKISNENYELVSENYYLVLKIKYD